MDIGLGEVIPHKKGFNMFTFSDALILATEAHMGKKDLGGIDYIKHPLYVYNKIRMKGGSNEAQMTAILHDVIEDSAITVDNLKCSGCPKSVIEALELLTYIPNKDLIKDRADEIARMEGVFTTELKHFDQAKEDSYLNYIIDLSENDIARAVKIEDLRHNSDIRRLKFTHKLKKKDILRITKYIKALQILTGGKVGYT